MLTKHWSIYFVARVTSTRPHGQFVAPNHAAHSLIHLNFPFESFNFYRTFRIIMKSSTWKLTNSFFTLSIVKFSTWRIVKSANKDDSWSFVCQR